MKKKNDNMRYIIIVIFILLVNSSFAQNYEQMEIEYNSYTKNNNSKLAILKAKEMLSYALKSERDTSVKFATCYKLIGNAFNQFGNNDSALYYYDLGLDVLEKQKQSDNILSAKFHYNISNIYHNLNKNELSLLESEKAIEILRKENFTEYPFCIWVLGSTANLYFLTGNLAKSEELYIKSVEIVSHFKGDTSVDYANSIENLACVYVNEQKFRDAENLFKEATDIYKNSLGKENIEYLLSLIKLGCLYEVIGKDGLAENNFIEALSIRKKMNLDKTIETADLLNNLANIYSHEKNYEVADSLYNVSKDIYSITEGENSKDYITTIGNLALMKLNNGQIKEAEKYCIEEYDKSEKYFKNDPQLIGHSTWNMALLNESKGNIDLAINLYKITLNINKTTFGIKSLKYIKTLRDLAKLYSSIDNYKNAENLYIETLQSLRENMADSLLYAQLLFNLGILYINTNNFQHAEKCFLETKEIYKNNYGIENNDFISSTHALGEVYYRLYNFNAAKQCFEEVYNYSLKNIKQDTLRYINSSISLFNTHLKLNDTLDRKYILYMSKLFSSLDSNFFIKNPRLLSDIGNLYAYYFYLVNDTNLVQNAIWAYKTEADIYIQKNDKRNNKQLSICLNNLGKIYYENKNYEDAKTTLSQCLNMYDNNNIRDDNYINCIYNMLKINFVNRDYASSYKILEEIYTYKNKVIADNFSFLDEKEKQSFWYSKENDFSELIYDCINSYYESPTCAKIAYNSIVLSKALLLKSSIDFNNVMNNSKDSTFLKVYKELKISRYYCAKLISEGSDRQYLISALEQKADSLDKLLSREMSSYTNYKKMFSVDLKDIQSKLSNDEASIEFVRYYNYKDSLYYYVALILKNRDKYPQLIKLCSENELTNNYTVIWKSISPYLGNIKTIYCANSGSIYNYNLSAIPIDSTITFGEKYNLHILGTTADLITYKPTYLTQKSIQSAIVYGGIDYDKANSSLIKSGESNDPIGFEQVAELASRGGNTIGKFGYLKGTEEETKNIENLCKTNNINAIAITGNNATEASFKQLSGKKEPFILHIATHGYFFPDPEIKKQYSLQNFNDPDKKNVFKWSDDPLLRSGLIFAGANKAWGNPDYVSNDSTEDGILTSYEISNLDLSNCQLVVLSACKTGLGDIKGSEGVFGLQRAFKMAGIKNIIMSLWKVPDAQTSELMTLFYNYCFAGKSVHDALQAAQTDMRKKGYAPYYWAAFKLLE